MKIVSALLITLLATQTLAQDLGAVAVHVIELGDAGGDGEHGISVQLGAHFGETSLLTAAGIIFATLAKDLRAVEGGFAAAVYPGAVDPAAGGRDCQRATGQQHVPDRL